MTGSSSPAREELLALLSRESRFDRLQSCRRKQFQKSPSGSFMSTTSGVTELGTSEEQRDLAAEWMYEVVIDSRVKLDVFLLSVTIMDSFLDVCPILSNQVQLLASACLLLAAKVRLYQTQQVLNEAQIIDYTDNSITQTELKVITTSFTDKRGVC